jgi:hypothetical protein
MEHIARMRREVRRGICLGNLTKKRTLVRPRLRLEDNIKFNLKSVVRALTELICLMTRTSGGLFCAW